MFGPPMRRQPDQVTTSATETTIRWSKQIWRNPQLVMIDIAYDKPLLRSLALIVGLYVLNAIAILLLGDRGMIGFAGQSVGEKLLWIGVGFGAVFGILFVYVNLTHFFSHRLEGQGSYRAAMGGGAFSLIPFLPNAGINVLLATPFVGESAAVLQFFVLLFAIGWTAFLYSHALRENHMFTDLQAAMAMLLPPAVIIVGSGFVLMIIYFVLVVT